MKIHVEFAAQEIEKLQQDTEKAIDIVMAVLEDDEVKTTSLVNRMQEQRAKITAKISEFRAELARVKLVYIRLQLLAKAGLSPIEDCVQLAEKKTAADAAEILMEELIEMESRLRQGIEDRPVNRLKERLEDIKFAMAKVFADLRL